VSMHPAVLKELERRGVSNVRLLLQNPDAAGVGRQAIVRLGTSGHDPPRGDVEDWLRGQEEAAERISVSRHRQLMRWAKIAGVGAVVGAVAAAAGVIVTILESGH
jgi:hypothetical protein